MADWQPIPQPVLTEEWEELIKRDEAGLFESPSSIQAQQPLEHVRIPHSPPTPVKGLRELANLVQGSFAEWQNIDHIEASNSTELLDDPQPSQVHGAVPTRHLVRIPPPATQESLRQPLGTRRFVSKSDEELAKDIGELTNSSHLPAKEMVSPEFPSSPTAPEGVVAHPATTTETTSTLTAISEPDIDLILEALAQEIQREYKRFYG